MKIRLTDAVESVHKWIDQETGKAKRYVIRAGKGTLLDSEQIPCGDPERALTHLVKLGLAEEA